MKYLAMLFTIVVAVSCGSTSIKQIKRGEPLPVGANIEVFTKTEPPYTYEVYCTAEIERSGSFVSTTLSGYKSEAEEIARQCGAPMAVVKSIGGFSGNGGATVTVKVEAGKRISEDAKLLEPSVIKKLTSAILLGNVKTTSAILKKYKVSPSVKMRSHIDSKLMNSIMMYAANKSSGCPLKTMAFLQKKYEVVIDSFLPEQKLSPEILALSNMLECPSEAIAFSFSRLEGEPLKKSIFELNNTVSEMINGGYYRKNSAKNFVKIFPTISNEVELSCKKDSLSELCSAKENLNNLLKVSKKMSSSAR